MNGAILALLVIILCLNVVDLSIGIIKVIRDSKKIGEQTAIDHVKDIAKEAFIQMRAANPVQAAQAKIVEEDGKVKLAELQRVLEADRSYAENRPHIEPQSRKITVTNAMTGAQQEIDESELDSL